MPFEPFNSNQIDQPRNIYVYESLSSTHFTYVSRDSECVEEYKSDTRNHMDTDIDTVVVTSVSPFYYKLL